MRAGAPMGGSNKDAECKIWGAGGEGASHNATSLFDIHDDYLKKIKGIVSSRGFEIECYKPDFLRRRIRARVNETTRGLKEYLQLIQEDPEESRRLLENISINVSEFFRDQSLWQKIGYAAKELIARKNRNGSFSILRVWCVACSCGEEPYTVAIVLSELLRALKYSGMPLPTVSIYATDIDADAIAKAKIGKYRAEALKNVPEQIKMKYFKYLDGMYAVSDELKSMVKFRVHNVVTDPPLQFLDMIFCRNLLIYFNASAQREILERLRDSLATGGFLVLGMTENMPADIHGISPYDIRNRIYIKI